MKGSIKVAVIFSEWVLLHKSRIAFVLSISECYPPPPKEATSQKVANPRFKRGSSTYNEDLTNKTGLISITFE